MTPGRSVASWTHGVGHQHLVGTFFVLAPCSERYYGKVTLAILHGTMFPEAPKSSDRERGGTGELKCSLLASKSSSVKTPTCRGTSFIRNNPPLGTYSRPVPWTLWWSWEKADCYERGTCVAVPLVLQGYLAHKKAPPPRIPHKGYAYEGARLPVSEVPLSTTGVSRSYEPPPPQDHRRP